MNKKNLFALKCMDMVNEMGATQPGASPVVVRNFDEEGNALFFHEDGDGDFGSQEMIEWFNIMMNDDDNQEDDMLTGDMYVVLEQGKAAGFITEETQKYW